MLEPPFCITFFHVRSSNTDTIQVTSSGDLLLRRHSTNDLVWKSALAASPNLLYVNRNKSFVEGIRLFGTAFFDEITINSQNTARIGFSTFDTFQFLNSSLAHYGLTFRPGNNVSLSGFHSLEFFTYGTLRMKILENGNVGIGTANPDEKLTVNGKIHAKEVKIDLLIPADYVFHRYYKGMSELNPDYEMMSLEELEIYIKENYHLPNIPSANKIQEEGLKLGEMSNLLLEKIEELTLHIIEQNKRIEKLEKELEKND